MSAHSNEIHEMKWFTASPFRRALGALTVIAGGYRVPCTEYCSVLP